MAIGHSSNSSNNFKAFQPTKPKAVVPIISFKRLNLPEVATNIVALCKTFAGTNEQIKAKTQETLVKTIDRISFKNRKLTREAIITQLIEEITKYAQADDTHSTQKLPIIKNLVLTCLNDQLKTTKPKEKTGYTAGKTSKFTSVKIHTIDPPLSEDTEQDVPPLSTLFESITQQKSMHDLASNSQVVFKYFDDKGGITENTIREFLREVDEAVEKTTLSLQEARQEKVMVLKIINMDSATLDRIELIELIANPEQPSRGDKRETELEELAKIPLAEFNIMPTYVTRERTATQWDRFGRTTKTKPIVTVNGKSTVIDNSEDKGKGAFGRARAVKQRNGTIIIAKKIIVPTLEQLLSTYEEYSASLDVTQKSKSAGTEVQNLQTLQIMDCHFHIGKKGNMVTLYSEKFDDTLSETLKSATLSEKIELFHEAAKALKQFHETNWVHNDVKPENFLVKIIKNKDNSRSFKVVIADLGLSFPNNSDPTVSTSVSWGQVGGTYPPIEALALREADGLNEDMNDIIEAEKIDYKPMDCFAFGVGLSSLVGSEPLRIDHNDNNESKFIILSWKNDTEKKCREVIAEHSQSKKQVKLATLIFNCIRDVKSRPTMSEIESRMKEIREIPDTD